MRRIRLMGIIVGAAATCAVFWLVFRVLGLPLFPVLYPEGVGLPTGLAWYAHVVRATLPPLASWLLVFFVGGLVAGGVVSAFPGLNGAASAAVTMLGGFAFFVGPVMLSVVPRIWEPISNPGEAYTRADTLSKLLEVSVVFGVVFLFVVLAGYAGGKLGSRLRPALGRR